MRVCGTNVVDESLETLPPCVSEQVTKKPITRAFRRDGSETGLPSLRLLVCSMFTTHRAKRL
jgi:hypothetical protein